MRRGRRAPTRVTAGASARAAASQLSTAIEFPELLVAQLEQRRRDVLFEMVDTRGARYGEHHGRALEQPRERHLRRGRVQSLGDARDRSARFREVAREQRKPRDERDALAFAILEHRLGAALDDVVTVLQRDAL